MQLIDKQAQGHVEARGTTGEKKNRPIYWVFVSLCDDDGDLPMCVSVGVVVSISYASTVPPPSFSKRLVFETAHELRLVSIS